MRGGLFEAEEDGYGQQEAIACIADENAAEQREEDEQRDGDVGFKISGQDADEIENLLRHAEFFRNGEQGGHVGIVFLNFFNKKAPTVALSGFAKNFELLFRNIAVQIGEHAGGAHAAFRFRQGDFVLQSGQFLFPCVRILRRQLFKILLQDIQLHIVLLALGDEGFRIRACGQCRHRQIAVR